MGVLGLLGVVALFSWLWRWFCRCRCCCSRSLCVCLLLLVMQSIVVWAARVVNVNVVGVAVVGVCVDFGLCWCVFLCCCVC